MNPRGETAFAVSEDLYLGLPGLETIHVASGLGLWRSSRSDLPRQNYASFVDGRWVFGIGGRLYELTDRPRCQDLVRQGLIYGQRSWPSSARPHC